MKDINKASLHFDDNIIQKGIENNLISFNDENTRIYYNVKTKKNYNYKDPEEKIRACVFIRLVLDYGYDIEDIDFEVIVPRRTPEDLADIVVYKKGNDKQPYLVVECKKDGISDSQFEQAIEQVFGNANSLRAKYAWVVAGNTETAFDIDNFDSMEREKNVISQIPVSYGKTPEFRFKKEKKGLKESKNSLKIVSREELIKTLEKCHDTVWQGGKLNPSDAFDEVSKILFCKLQDEKKTKVDGFYKFQVGTHEKATNVAQRIHGLYKEGKEQDPNVFSEDIKLENDIIYKTVEHLQSININKTDLDSKGVAFERFMGDFFKGKMGQYFTPRNIVDFCVKMLFIKQNERVIDPACGSGGFLLHAMDLIRKEAEANYDDENEIFSYWHDFASKNLFGIEINEQIARVCKMNMIIHDDGHTNVISADSLDNIEKHTKLNSQFKKENFDIILTNPPFGAKVLFNEKKYLQDYDLGLNNGKVRAAQNTEVLFIERCSHYLKIGGRMAIVLPDGILTNATLQYVRDFIMENFIINAIVSIPQTAFSHYGAGVKCSLLFLTKSNSIKENYDIFMAQAEYVGYDATGREIAQNDLNEIFDDYKNFIEKKNFKLNGKCFLVKFNSIKLTKRIDAFGSSLINVFYQSKKFENKKLSDLVNIQKGETITNETKENGNIPVIAGGQVPAYYNNKSNYNGNVITISASGAYSGFVWWHDNPIWASDCNVLTEKSNEVNIKYIYHILKLNQENIYKLQRGSAQPHVYASDLSEIPIPIPPIETQNKIVDIMKDAYLQKEKFEKEADNLLNSIDDYILNELGITLPKKETNLKNRISYTVKFNDIKGKRFDCEYHQVYYNELKKSLIEGKYKLEKINQLMDNIKIISKPSEEEITYIEIGDIDVENAIINLKSMKLKKLPNNSKIYIKQGDLLISKVRPNRKAIAIYNEKEGAYCTSAFCVLRENGKYKKELLQYLLRTNILNSLIVRNVTGSTYPTINDIDILNLEIPLPPIEIQQKIVDEINERKKKALNLQKEAKEILENAKSQAEKIIF